jgi:hypothetical protein
VGLRAAELKHRCGDEVVLWLSIRLDQRVCEACGCDHDFRLGPRVREPPKVMLVASPTLTAEKVWSALSCTALCGDDPDRCPLIDYHLVALVPKAK